jgi:predicted phosphoserine aminotransferase
MRADPSPARRPFGRFFFPGPTEVHPEVLDAMRAEMIPHRGAELEALVTRLEAPLKALFRTREPVLIGTCSATGFMEAAIRNGVEHRVLAVVGGAFGERFAQVAEACGKEVIRAIVAQGRTMEPEYLAQFLQGPEVDAVALVHSETSTGALAPLEQLAAVVRGRPNVMLLVDAVSSLGGCPVETDAWGLDFVFTGSQKALALPPGLALGVASPRLLARARGLSDRGHYFDLPTYHQFALRHQPPTTPALSLYRALDCQLERIAAEGGVEARWRRHYEMLLMVERWVAAHPAISFLPAEGRRSASVSCLRLPEGVSATAFVGWLRERGWTIGTGYGALRDSTIRLGHMGDLKPVHLEELLQALEQRLGAAPGGEIPVEVGGRRRGR